MFWSGNYEIQGHSFAYLLCKALTYPMLWLELDGLIKGVMYRICAHMCFQTISAIQTLTKETQGNA